MIELIREGALRPPAADVAERAGVGIRSVFRHFEDMETLYREITAETAPRLLSIVEKPGAAKDWRGRLDEMLERRRAINEDLLPLKRAASLHRLTSPFLQADHRDHLRLEREALAAILPRAIKSDAARFTGLVAATSFETWRHLRDDLALSERETAKVVRTLVDAVTVEKR